MDKHITNLLVNITKMDLVELDNLNISVNHSLLDSKVKKEIFLTIEKRQAELKLHNIDDAMAVCAKIDNEY